MSDNQIAPINSDYMDHNGPRPGSGSSRTLEEISISELVFSAMYHLKETKGITLREIIDYISREYNGNSEELKRSIQTALKRGIEYGIIRYANNGHYILQASNSDNIIALKSRGICGKRRKRPRCGHRKRRSSHRRRSCGHRKRRACKRRRCIQQPKKTCPKSPRHCGKDDDTNNN